MKFLKALPKPKQLVKHSGHLLQQNSPTLLSAVAVVGVAGTAYFTWKASRQHAQIIEHETAVARISTGDVSYTFTREAEFARVWKFYIPAVGVAAGTVFCIVASNRIAMRRLAALATAYGVLSGDFDEYRAKAREVLGEKKGKKLDDDVAEKKMQDVSLPPASQLGENEAWFVDLSSMRPFKSTREKIEKGRNDINYQLLHGGEHSVDLNDAYAHCGLEATGVGGMLGWSSEQQVEIAFTPVFMTDGQTATGFAFLPEAKPDFDAL